MAWQYSLNKQIRLSFTLAAVIIIVLFGKLPDNSLFWQEVQNTGHSLLFMAIAVLILLLLQDSILALRRASLKLYVAAGMISLSLGMLTEFVQLLMGSDSSVADIMRDFTGIIAGLGLSASRDGHLQPHWLKSRKIMKAGTVALTVCVCAASLFPLAYLSSAYMQRNEAFPVVLDLNEKWAVPFVHTKKAVVKVNASKSVNAVKNVTRRVLVQFNPGAYPGVSMVELYPDWSSFETLTLNIYSEQAETFDLVMRIHDEQHNNYYKDRFNKKLIVKAGENHFHVPLQEIELAPMNRKMDMKKVSTLVLFAKEVVVPLRFFLGVIRLE